MLIWSLLLIDPHDLGVRLHQSPGSVLLHATAARMILQVQQTHTRNQDWRGERRRAGKDQQAIRSGNASSSVSRVAASDTSRSGCTTSAIIAAHYNAIHKHAQ